MVDATGQFRRNTPWPPKAQRNRERQTDNPFAYLSPNEFVLLTTFRKSGVGVPTAMWFAHEQGKLYMVTGRTTGKIKRIRNNGRVLLAPCDLMGKMLGLHIEAFAYELPVAQHVHANALCWLLGASILKKGISSYW